MHKPLLAALLSVIVAGCISMPPMPHFLDQPSEYESHGSTIQHISGNHFLEVHYKTADVLAQEAIHRAEQRGVEPTTNNIPAGGIVFVTLYTGTIGAADPALWELFARDSNDREFARRRGRQTTPNHIQIHGVTFWHSTIAMALAKPQREPFSLFVYDDVNTHRSEYRIIPATNDINTP